jgi:hypothetical protein
MSSVMQLAVLGMHGMPGKKEKNQWKNPDQKD